MAGLKNFLFIISSLFLFYTTEAKYIYIFDFDGTLVDDSRVNSSWKTPWILRKVDQVRSSAQLNQSLVLAGDTIEISAGEYIAYMGQWSVGNGSIGSSKEIRLLKDPYLKRPDVIIPGHYYVDPNLTYKFYRSNTDGINYLINNLQEAQARIKSQKLDPLDFTGPAFAVFQTAMANPLSVGDVHIFTARNQSSEEFQTFFDQLKLFGLIENSTGLNRRGLLTMPTVHQLQGIESILYGRSLTEGKKNVVDRIVKLATNTNSPTSFDYSAENPNEIVGTHTVIVAEDDPLNIKVLIQLMTELSHGHSTRNLKLVLMNTAPESVLVRNPFPNNQRWLVFNHGFVRPATEKEVNNYTGIKVIEQNQRKISLSESTNFNICSEYLSTYENNIYNRGL